VFDPAVIIWEYDITTIASYTGDDAPCGDPQIEFLNADGTWMNNFVFLDNRWMSPFTFEVFSFSSWDAGSYDLQFKFWYSQQPSNVVMSQVFTVVISDPCDDPGFITLTPPVTIQMINFFTVGMDTPVYQIPTFETNMPECGNFITYTIEFTPDQEMAGLNWSLEIFDQDINIFDQLFLVDFLCGYNQQGKTHQFKIVGTLAHQTAYTMVSITFLNPCFD
jgi:hypothetical protein